MQQEFGSRPTCCGVAPGRVNLIGEHTDYNCGYVLPTALPLATIVVGSQKEEGESSVSVLSACAPASDPPARCDFDIAKGLVYSKDDRPRWANYVRGVVANFHRRLDRGFSAVIVSSVPLGEEL